MTEEKIALIDKICKLRPSIGVEKGWSHYTGGMKDDGSWHFRKMLDIPIEELQEFYDAEILKQDQWKLPQAKEQEDFKSSGMTVHEWNIKQFQDMNTKINLEMANIIFKDYIDGGTLIKPKENNNDTSK
jgi:hypothetical protein